LPIQPVCHCSCQHSEGDECYKRKDIHLHVKTAASAPGKIILFGEHAVVFGESSIATALQLRIRVKIEDAERESFNGVYLDARSTPHAFHALRLSGRSGVGISVSSDIPAGAGLGSSAALSVALIRALRPEIEERELAELSYRVELAAQGRASPADTSIATHGRAIYISSRETAEELWSIRGNEVTWHVSHLEMKQIPVVIGFTGIQAATGPLVMKVKTLYEKYKLVREAIAEIGLLTEEAVVALRRNDLVRIGELMDRNQRLLTVIGVSSREIEKLIDAVRPYSYGAKLTGAGGGGCIIAVTDNPERVREAIELRGGSAFITSIYSEGARCENE